MNKEEIVNQVRSLFNLESTVVEDKPVDEVVQKFVEAVLKDGVKVMSPDEELKIGSELKVVAEDGSLSPVLDDEHELEDGTIVVTVEGKVTEIREALEEEVEVEVEEVVTVEEFNKLTDKVEKLEADLATKTDLEAKFSKVKEATLFLADEFSKLPGGEKLEIKKAGYEPETKALTKDEKFVKLMKSIREN